MSRRRTLVVLARFILRDWSLSMAGGTESKVGGIRFFFEVLTVVIEKKMRSREWASKNSS